MKKVYKILPYIIVIVLTIVIFKQYQSNKDFKANINALESEKDSIGNIILQNDKTILNLNKELKKTQYNYIAIMDKLKQQQNATDNVPNIVIDYDVKQLDSIITNYRHIERPKN